MKKIKCSVFLFIAALIWGVAFVAQDVGLAYIEPFTFTCVRFFLGGISLLIISVVFDLIKKKGKEYVAPTPEEKKKNIKSLLIGGSVCGAILCVATNFQQFGLVYTTPGKSGFITDCYIVLVPIIGIFLRRKCPITVWIAVIIALVGLYFLCLSDGFDGFNKGDLITLFCSIGFAFHIIAVDKFLHSTDALKLSYMQCFVCSLISGVCMFIFETPKFENILLAWLPIVYTGVCSAGIAYMFQILGQKDLNPTVASLIMSTEAGISVLASWIILKEVMSPKEIIGCVIIFCAIILAQIPLKKYKSKKEVNPL